VTALAVAALLALPPGTHAASRAATVDHVADGDTIVLRGGERVRLVQIDTPEVYGQAECFGRRASAATEAILAPGTRVRVVTDPSLDQRDRDGRTLAYVWKGASLVNLRLVRAGEAAPYFYDGDEGRYAALILEAAVAARKAGRGLWGHCLHGAVPLRPTRGVATGPVASTRSAFAAVPAGSAAAGCNPNYTPCVPHAAGDLDCPDVGHPVRVVGSDPYHLDGDGDGYGCESE
jgi:micrococcal nuclease